MNESDKRGTVRITAMRGLPRSGKSTIAKRISSRWGYPIISRDAVRLAVHGETFIAEREQEVTMIEGAMVRALCYAGHDALILDECNADAVAAKARIEGFLEGTDFECDIQFAVMDTPPEVCKQRAIECGQECLLPVIDRMLGAWTI